MRTVNQTTPATPHEKQVMIIGAGSGAFAAAVRAAELGARVTFVEKGTVKKGTDTIVGATIVAGRAGDLISEITLAMNHGLGLKEIGSTIHPCPTQAEAIRKLGDQYNRTWLTPFIKWLFTKWLAWIP